MKITGLIYAAAAAATLDLAAAADGSRHQLRATRGRHLQAADNSKAMKEASKSSKAEVPPPTPVPPVPPATPVPPVPNADDDDRFAASTSTKSGKSETSEAKSAKSLETGLESAKSLKSAKSAKTAKSAKSIASKGGKQPTAAGVCQQHMSTVADVVACMEAALNGTQPEGVDFLNNTLSVNRCIYWSTSPETLSVTNKTWNQTDDFQKDMAHHERNNGLYDGVVAEGSLRGPGFAFAWVRGSDQIVENLRNLANCTITEQKSEDECVREVLVEQNMRQGGMDPEGGVSSLYVLDACKISHVGDRNDASPAYTVGIAPVASNLVRYIEAEFLQKDDAHAQKSFSYDTVAALNPSLSTPVENYEAVTGCPANASAVLDPDAACNATGVNATAAAVRPYSYAGAMLGNTSACLDAYLGLGPAVWDTPGGLRVALEACVDASRFTSLTGLGWYPDLGFTGPQWFLPNTQSVHDLRYKAHLATLYASCDSDDYANVTACTLLPLYDDADRDDAATKSGKSAGSKAAKSSLAPTAPPVQALSLTAPSASPSASPAPSGPPTQA